MSLLKEEFHVHLLSEDIEEGEDELKENNLLALINDAQY